MLVSNSTFINNYRSVVFVRTGSSLTIERCSFRNNSGDSNGGVIANEGPVSISILCSTFSNNVATQHGSVIYMRRNAHGPISVSIKRSSFYNNTAIVNGGVIYMDNSNMDSVTLDVVGSNFNKNSAGGDGGVLYLRGILQATVHNSTFTNNNVPNTGGVSYATGSTLTISETNFLNNTALMVVVWLEPVTAVRLQLLMICLLYTSPSPRDATLSRMPSSA